MPNGASLPTDAICQKGGKRVPEPVNHPSFATKIKRMGSGSSHKAVIKVRAVLLLYGLLRSATDWQVQRKAPTLICGVAVKELKAIRQYFRGVKNNPSIRSARLCL